MTSDRARCTLALPLSLCDVRSPLLRAWIWRLIQRAVCLALHAHSGSRLYSRYIATAVCLTPGPGCSEFVSDRGLIAPPLTSSLRQRHQSAPTLCDVRGQRGRRGAPPDIRQQTDGTARHGTLVFMYTGQGSRFIGKGISHRILM